MVSDYPDSDVDIRNNQNPDENLGVERFYQSVARWTASTERHHRNLIYDCCDERTYLGVLGLALRNICNQMQEARGLGV